MGDARGVNKGEEEGIMGGSCSGRRRVFGRFDPIWNLIDLASDDVLKKESYGRYILNC